MICKTTENKWYNPAAESLNCVQSCFHKPAQVDILNKINTSRSTPSTSVPETLTRDKQKGTLIANLVKTEKELEQLSAQLSERVEKSEAHKNMLEARIENDIKEKGDASQTLQERYDDACVAYDALLDEWTTTGTNLRDTHNRVETLKHGEAATLWV